MMVSRDHYKRKDNQDNTKNTTPNRMMMLRCDLGPKDG